MIVDPIRGELHPTRRNVLVAGGVLLASSLTPPSRAFAQNQPQRKAGEKGDRTVGLAIVGIGTLSMNQILPGLAKTKHCFAAALVSGHPDKAKAQCEKHGIDPKNIYSYENYEAVKDNPAVQAVYVVLPNAMHAEYTVRAAKVGKHVLTEKPMEVSSAKCREMIEACRAAGKKLMVAYRLRYEPNNQRMIEMCRKQQYGPLRLISANNTQNTNAPNIRLSKKTGGGPVGDVGVYCINACRYLTGEEPVEVVAMQTKPANDPRFEEVPASVTFQLRFPSGVLAHCACGFDETSCRDFRVIAKDGFYGLDPAYDYHGIRGYVNTNKGREDLKAPDINQFAAEMDHMAQCVLDDKQPLTPGEEGLADMKVIAAIDASIEGGKVVRIG